MKPIQAMTTNEAREMKARAIERAKALEIVKMVHYLLGNDPTTNGEDYKTLSANDQEKYKVEPVDPRFRGRPLPGSGLLMSGTLISLDQYILSVHWHYNPTERVFHYERNRAGPPEVYHTFREGSWVSVLRGNYNAVKWRKENADLIEISGNFSPVEVPHRPEQDR